MARAGKEYFAQRRRGAERREVSAPLRLCAKSIMLFERLQTDQSLSPKSAFSQSPTTAPQGATPAGTVAITCPATRSTTETSFDNPLAV